MFRIYNTKLKKTDFEEFFHYWAIFFIHKHKLKLKDPFLDDFLVKIKITYQVVKKKYKNTTA